MKASKWIINPKVDLLLILSPSIFTVVGVFLFSSYFVQNQEVSVLWWLVLVLGIDVSHVYSTLFRTYLDNSTFQKHKSFLIVTPIIVFVITVLLYSLGRNVYWTFLAYLAVFHFVRQQYGFLRIYQNKEIRNQYISIFEHWFIYSLMLVPIYYWHIAGDRTFNWFVENDFFSFVNFKNTWIYVNFTYIFLIFAYTVIEIYHVIKNKTINIGKNLLLLGTGLSWYMGIVYFNSDLIFSLLNIISHGIPYIVLVWFYQFKKNNGTSMNSKIMSYLFSIKGIILFVMFLFLVAFVEETLWDWFVWKEHSSLFGSINIELPTLFLRFIVPMLSVPQITHYIIDGYIWKIKNDEFDWKKYFV